MLLIGIISVTDTGFRHIPAIPLKAITGNNIYVDSELRRFLDSETEGLVAHLSVKTQRQTGFVHR